MMKIAIVLHMGQNGLGITRSLGRKGIEVYGIDHEKDATGFSSRYCKQGFIFPNPLLYPQECLNKFIELGNNLADKAVLLPASDYYVDFISEFEADLSPYFLFNIPDSSILENIVDKSKQYKLAEQLGIPVPKTLSPQHIDDLKEGLLSYPVLIKGVSSHRWHPEFHNKGFIAHSFDDLGKYFELASHKNLQVIIQEMVIGPNKNHFKVCAYYSKERKLLAVFSTQKTRQFPVDLGIGSYMTSGNYPELIALGRKFFEGAGYTGMGSIEFKKDDRDGEFKLLELNPRFWQQNIQAACAGVNFPYINYLDCIGEKVDPSFSFKENIRWLDAVADLQSFVINRKRGDISFLEWVKSILRADCFAYFSGDDLKPVGKYLAFIAGRVLRKIGPTP
jgi:predicted ATP-grasp superfamily ATP-dependent carboligase